MILMPVWVEKEDKKGIYALLGSEPKKDSKTEWIPKECIQKCVYSEQKPVNSRRFAMVVLTQEGMPERIKMILGLGEEK